MPTFTAYPEADAYVSYVDNYSGRGSVTWDEAATESVGTSFTDEKKIIIINFNYFKG